MKTINVMARWEVLAQGTIKSMARGEVPKVNLSPSGMNTQVAPRPHKCLIRVMPPTHWASVSSTSAPAHARPSSV